MNSLLRSRDSKVLASLCSLLLAAMFAAPSLAFAASYTWTDRLTVASWSSITSSADGTKLAATTFHSDIYTSTDSGAHWTDQTAAGSHDWTDITSSSDGTKLAATADGGDIYTSTDSGAHWTDETGSGALHDLSWNSITSSSDGTKLAAVIFGGDIYTSTDSGAHWTDETGSGALHDLAWRSITSSSDGTKLAAAVGNGGDIYTSTDSGAHWTDQTAAGSHDWTGITSSSDGTKLAATVNNGDIYTSADSGAHWTDQTAAGSGAWLGITSSSDGTKLAATFDGGDIYASADSGATWNDISSAIGTHAWRPIASSADGSKLVAANTSDIWTGALPPVITNATYDASTGALAVTGTNFVATAGATNDIVANKFTLTGEGGTTYTLTDTANVEITSSTSFTLTLSATDKAAVNEMMNNDGTVSTGGTTYNLAAAEDWDAGSSGGADTTGNGITVSNVAIPTITSATYDASTGVLVVTGTGFLASGEIGTNDAGDINTAKLTFLGNGNATYTLTNTPIVEITSGTSFTVTLDATDKDGVNALLNENGTAASDGTTYNLAAGEDWDFGAFPTLDIADTTGNPITVSGNAFGSTKTTAGSRNWTSITSSSDGSVLAASVFNGDLYVSTTSGATWTDETSAGTRSWKAVVSSYDGSVLAAADQNFGFGGDIYVSTTTGDTWTDETGSGARDWQSLAISGDGSTIIGGLNGGDVYLSTDGGKTWNAQSLGSHQWQALAASEDGSTLAAGIFNGGLYVSTTSGATWTQTSAGSRYWQSISISPDGSTITAAANGNGVGDDIFVSTDSGSTWTSLSSAGKRDWRAVTSSTNGRVLAGAVFGGTIYSSTDSGATWTALSSAGVANWTAMAATSDGDFMAAAISNGDIWTLDIAIPPSITTRAASSVAGTSVTGNGTVVNSGGENVVRGFVYGTTAAYNATTTLDGLQQATGDFSGTIDHLSCDTTYHYAAFGSNGVGISYGSDQTFTTTKCAPFVQVDGATAITQTSATVKATIISTGGEDASGRGFSYGIGTPFGATSPEEIGTFGIGDFTADLSGLSCGTTYEYAGYAVNTMGTSSVTEDTFTTSACPEVATGNGMVFSGSASDLSGYVAPRPQIIEPDGTVVYLDSGSGAAATSTAVVNSIIPGNESPTLSGATNTTYHFTRDLERGMYGDDVLALQRYLNTHGFVLAESGDGSPGHETTFFGQLTFNALVKFQEAHADQILTPLHLTAGTGYFGPSTRAFVNGN